MTTAAQVTINVTATSGGLRIAAPNVGAPKPATICIDGFTRARLEVV